MDIRIVDSHVTEIIYKDNGIIAVEDSPDFESLKTFIRDECLMLFKNPADFVHRLFNLSEIVRESVARDSAGPFFEVILQVFTTLLDSALGKTRDLLSTKSNDLSIILNETWRNYFMPLKCILQKLVYLDVWLSNQSRKKTLSESVLRAFRERKTSYNDIYSKIEQIILQELNICRFNNIQNCDRFIYLIKLIDYLGAFDEFKANLSSNTIEYYSAPVKTWIRDMSFSEYVNHIRIVYINEYKLLDNFLDKDDISNIMKGVFRVLVDGFQANLLTLSNITGILIEKNYALLKLVKTLFSRNCEDFYIKILVQSLVKIGLDLILQGIDEGLIPRLMQFNSFVLELRRFGFNCDYQFEDKLKIWRTILENINALRFVLCGLSLFFDHILKIPNFINSDEFKFAISLFKYIKCKDDFEKLLRHVTGHRLVLTHNLTDSHRALIDKLRCDFGLSFTHQLTIMLNDFNQSCNLNNEFIKSNRVYSNHETLVISQLVWFKNKICDTLQLNFDQSFDNFNTLPKSDYEEGFNHFYRDRYKNRRLRYIPEYYIIHLSARFKKARITFQLSLIQATLLIMFNDKNLVTLEDLRSELIRKSYGFSTDLDTLMKIHINELSSTVPSIIHVTNIGYELNKGYFSSSGFVQIYKPDDINIKFNLDIITDNVTVLDRDTACRIDFMLVKCIKANGSCTFDNICKFIHSNMDTGIDLIKKQLDGLVERKFVKFESNLYIYIP